jgi:flagellar hook-basal body complex protein FliE
MVDSVGPRSSSLLRAGLSSARQQVQGQSGGLPDPAQTFDRLVAEITGGGQQALAQSGLQQAQAALPTALGSARTGSAGTGPVGAGSAPSSPLAEMLREGFSAVQREVAAADELGTKFVRGEVASFEELAAQVKRADLTLRFSLEIRNQLVDAYREVMRMSV